MVGGGENDETDQAEAKAARDERGEGRSQGEGASAGRGKGSGVGGGGRGVGIAEEKLLEDPHATFLEADPLVGFARADALCRRMDLYYPSPDEVATAAAAAVGKGEGGRALAVAAEERQFEWWEAPGRIRHGILSTLNQLTWAQGHCCTPA